MGFFTRWLAPERPSRIGLPETRRTPFPREGWVICQVSIGGRPIRFYRWCNREVWRFTTIMERAVVFPTRDDAMRELIGSTVSAHDVQVLRLDRI